MMKKIFLILFFSAFAASFAQEATFESVKKQFENFQYDEMIKSSDKLIAKGALSDSLLIEVHLMRANVFYTNGSDELTKKSFESILAIKKNYIPDPTVTSPKLTAIFNEVKLEYLKKNPDVVPPADSTGLKPQTVFQKQFPQPVAVVKNIFAPGLGQLHHGNTAKGWVTLGASAIALASSVYFAIDANKKQSDYLAETNQQLIQLKYDDYNKSFKARNASLITLAAIWLYSQIDLFFFSEDSEQSSPGASGSISIKTGPANTVLLGYKIPF